MPGNHDKPGSRQIELTFLVLKSLSEGPAAEPVVYLHGGPRSGVVGNPIPITRFLNEIRDRRDIIAFDQRRVDTSAGPEFRFHATVADPETLADAITASGSKAERIARGLQAVRACLTFTSDEIAARRPGSGAAPAADLTGPVPVSQGLAETALKLAEIGRVTEEAVNTALIRLEAARENAAEGSNVVEVFDSALADAAKAVPNLQARIASTLPKGQLAIRPEAGHGTFLISDCPRDIAASFLGNPEAPVNTSCTADLIPGFPLPDGTWTK